MYCPSTTKVNSDSKRFLAHGGLHVDKFWEALLAVAPTNQCHSGLFFSERAVWGVGCGVCCLPDFLFCSLFPLQQTTSGM